MRKVRKNFDKRIGETTGTPGRFAESMIRPGIVELFCDRGYMVKRVYQNHYLYDKDENYFAEIDLLLVNKTIAIAVEAKTTLTVAEVKEHIARLEKIQKKPDEILVGKTIFGAIAGMTILEEADKYAYRHGLFVLKQKGEFVTIAKNNKFRPKEWKTA